MLTTIILFLALVIIAGLAIALYEDENDLTLLFIWEIIIVIAVSVITIIDVNSSTNIEKSSKPIIPELKIETKIINNEIVSIDTTYIYEFENN